MPDFEFNVVTVGVSSVMVNPDVSTTVPLVGVVPVTVALLVTFPLSISDCLIVYVAVAVPVAFGANVVGVTAILTVPVNGSFMTIFFKVAFPVFVTVKV